MISHSSNAHIWFLGQKKWYFWWSMKARPTGQTGMMTSQEMSSKIQTTAYYLTSQIAHSTDSFPKSSMFVKLTLPLCVFSHAQMVSWAVILSTNKQDASLWATNRLMAAAEDQHVTVNVTLTHTKTPLMHTNPFLSFMEHFLGRHSWGRRLRGQTLCEDPAGWKRWISISCASVLLSFIILTHWAVLMWDQRDEMYNNAE